MMATTAVIGLTAGKRLLSSSYHYSDLTEKLPFVNDNALAQYQITSTKKVISSKKSSNFSPSFPSASRQAQSIKVVKEDVDIISSPSTAEPWLQRPNNLEEESSDPDYLVEALLLLQKSMLEKQWNLSFEQKVLTGSARGKNHRKIPVTCSGVSARQRRMKARKKLLNKTGYVVQPNTGKQLRSLISPELLQNHSRGYVNGVVSEELLTHADVVCLSKKIGAGLSLEEHKLRALVNLFHGRPSKLLRLKERLGCEPSDDQIATSLRIPLVELQSKLIECSLAREKLAMSNVRLVMSIAQRYENMGAEMADLVQGGLIGLLRGIEKFDSSKGCRISTYVYWWIRQGVSRTLVENSRTLRLPAHMHERLGLIRNAKVRLEEKGITPSIDRIAECLKMSKKKVKNATEAISKVFSLDREAFPSLNGLPGETHHSYIADNRLENNPWHGVDELALKDEVNKLINMTLGERERDIIRLYHGLDNECLTWEDISKRIGLSRERVRQVGLVALEKLKHAARKSKMEAMLVKH